MHMNTKNGKVGKLCLSFAGGVFIQDFFQWGEMCMCTCWCTRRDFVEILDIFKDKKHQIKL